MSEVQVRSQSGEVVGTVTLEEGVFGAQVNVPVMHQVVVAQLAAARSGTASTKRRGEVRGGGKKPWRQKGTGRARQGSTRAPHWMGGGVVMGPKPRDFEVKVPKKMRAAALRSALSDRAREEKIAVVDEFRFEGPKTKDAVKLLQTAGVTGKALIVLDEPDAMVAKSFRNLRDVHVLTAGQLNTYDVLAADWVIFTKAALTKVSETRNRAPSRRAKSEGATA